jgi:hypothetical protein
MEMRREFEKELREISTVSMAPIMDRIKSCDPTGQNSFDRGFDELIAMYNEVIGS